MDSSPFYAAKRCFLRYTSFLLQNFLPYMSRDDLPVT
jgi:hypothetical protein